jgi:uncharacterized protein with HEPN domain
MSFEPRDYLRHILAEADYLVDQSRTLTADRFETDATLQRAFVRSLAAYRTVGDSGARRSRCATLS